MHQRSVHWRGRARDFIISSSSRSRRRPGQKVRDAAAFFYSKS